MRETNEKYFKSMQELQSTLSWHKQAIGKLERARLKEDLALDTLLLLTTAWLVNTRLIHGPLRWILQLFFGNKKNRIASSARTYAWLLAFFAKLVMMLLLTHRVRKWAIQ